MSTYTPWQVQGAQCEEELLNILNSAANGLKTQVIASPVLETSQYKEVRERLSAIADELFGMQQDIVFPQVE